MRHDVGVELVSALAAMGAVVVVFLVAQPRKKRDGPSAGEEGSFRPLVTSPDEARCHECGGDVEAGYLTGGDYIIWRPGGRQRRGRERLDDAGWKAVRQPARRCTACRLVWFEY